MDHPLRSYLDRTGLTLEKFGASVGVAQSTLSRIIHRRHMPSMALVARIALATKGALSANDFLPPAPPPRARTRTREGRAA